MSTFDNPFDPDRRLRCAAAAPAASMSAKPNTTGRAGAALRAARRARSSATRASSRSAVMRAMFPQDAARRAFLKSVGASTALAAISQFFPLKTATEVFAQARHAREEGPQGRLHPDHLRDADHHGASARLLCQAGPQRRSREDRRLGRHPRQDHQQGIRRRAHAGADADRDLARARLERRSPSRCRRSRTSTGRASRSP